MKKKFNQIKWWFEPNEKELYLPELPTMNIKIDKNFLSTKFLKIPKLIPPTKEQKEILKKGEQIIEKRKSQKIC